MAVHWTQSTSIFVCQQMSPTLVRRRRVIPSTLLAPPLDCGLAPLPEAWLPGVASAVGRLPSQSWGLLCGPFSDCFVPSHCPQPPLRAAILGVTTCATAVVACPAEVTARCHVHHGGWRSGPWQAGSPSRCGGGTSRSPRRCGPQLRASQG